LSSALAIAGVTAVLRDLLNDGLINHDASGTLGSTVTVSVLAPDRVLSGGGTEASQLNLFLYQVTPNTGWINERLPAVDSSGRTRLSNPILALNLHYLLSAYGSSDLHREILLGYAMQILHENPVIARQAIRTALTPSPDVGTTLPAALRALADCGLADQMEQLRITSEYLSTEEISKLWAATQSSYRPTAAYEVTVVLIESTQPASSPLPVLERRVFAEPSLVPPVPMLDEVSPAGEQPVVRLGETVDLEGHDLDGTGHEVLLSNSRFDVQAVLTPTSAGSEGVQFVIPEASAADFPVGVYQVSVRLVRPGGTDAAETNSLAFVLAPKITNLPLSTALSGSGTASFSIDFVPLAQPGQTVSLFLRDREIAPESFTAPVGTLSFVVDDVQKTKYLTRLRIDGIDSPIIDRSTTPPTFFNQEIELT
jgi:hypothetical protein